MARSNHAYTEEEISGLFGHDDREWFGRNRNTMIEKHGFPPALPKPGQRRYSRAQVDRWFATGGKTYQPGRGDRVGIDEPTITFRLDKLGNADGDLENAA